MDFVVRMEEMRKYEWGPGLKKGVLILGRGGERGGATQSLNIYYMYRYGYPYIYRYLMILVPNI